jgi:alpha-N-arabinofuranosidase
MVDTILTLQRETPLGTISPRLYGHFAEHLGRCCYDGLWVGTTNPARSHQHGFHTEVLNALQALPVPLLRWPGGCYAEHYHWRDGIGPVEERPRRMGISCGLNVEDDNSLGTHEFLHLCALLGAEPYLAGNLGIGTPQELCDWLEYCNSHLDTALTRERKANGHAEPFGVRLWGVGNENWGCGGNFDVISYANEYRRYATFLRHVDPSAELVTCGFDDNWNSKLLHSLDNHLDLINHLSIHVYWQFGGPERDFTEHDYYALLTEAQATEDVIKRTASIIQEATGGRHRIGIALDEWGVWHPEARSWGAGMRGRLPVTYEQAGTLRDALAAGVAFEGFHRQCNVLTLANLAQIVNVLHAPIMTQGDRAWLTPTYHALRLHAPHIGAVALPVAIERGSSLPDGSSSVSATASRNDEGLAVTLINRHFTSASSVHLQRIDDFTHAYGQLLYAEQPNAVNSLDAPDAVAPTPLAVAGNAHDGWHVELPPHSMATIIFRA